MSDSGEEQNLDELEKRLREKALQSMQRSKTASKNSSDSEESD